MPAPTFWSASSESTHGKPRLAYHSSLSTVELDMSATPKNAWNGTLANSSRIRRAAATYAASGRCRESARSRAADRDEVQVHQGMREMAAMRQIE